MPGLDVPDQWAKNLPLHCPSLSVWRAAAADVGCGCARLGLLNQHSHHHHMLNHPVLVLINISFLESFLSDGCSFDWNIMPLSFWDLSI